MQLATRISAAAWAAALAGGLSQAQLTSRVSVGTSGVQGNGISQANSISADGRFVVFVSQAANLVAGDTNAAGDVFVRDRLLGTIERVSLGQGGVQGNDQSAGAALSADGRFVAFLSVATNLVPGDTNGWSDIFVRDRQLGTTERVSVDSNGVQGNIYSYDASISADGRYVAFSSDASNLVAGDTNGNTDVFVHDRLLGTTERVSIGSTGAQGSGVSAQISADGRCVVFLSIAALNSADGNGKYDVYLRDRVLGTTEPVSLTNGGNFSYSDNMDPALSADGRFVSFTNQAANMTSGDMNGVTDIFVRDRLLATTERVSVGANGVEGNEWSYNSSISADGRYVAFASESVNLVAGDANLQTDIFVRDRQNGTTELVSVGSDLMQGNAGSGMPAISADGRFVSFTSDATTLAPGDTNGVSDVFLRDRHASGFSSLCDPGVAGVMPCPCANPPSASGRGCDNSDATGGAALSASGYAYLSLDLLVFHTSGEKATATSVLLQGSTQLASGAGFGQGVRCAGGSLRRLFVKQAAGGAIVAPDFSAGDATVSTRSAYIGDPLQAGAVRYYLVYYRDPSVLGGCAAANTFNATQTGRVEWSL